MTLPRKPAAVVFDMDGLLFDTETLSFEAAVTAAAQHGHAIDWPFFSTLIGRAWPDISLHMTAHLGDGFAADDFRVTWLDHYSALLAGRLALKAGVLELLDILDSYAIPRAIATSSMKEKALYNLERFSLMDRFHHVIAQGDYAASKPAPDPFLKASERLGVAPALCLALEDSHNGIKAAHSAGMMAIMVPDLLEPTEEIRALCEHVLTDLHQVADLIMGMEA
ncbi:HAD family phosphatase [Rhizobium sp. L1K21]|uniref:HAD family hydrolase n=1 Tax=Rhizobium sp. L1K21 TaxID=2954933 RepID=UPI00209357E0|nr:HAD family phosphatase [Rhizobium sp. L1K21]MCO6185020.1 HAD family phosphatase [Rhizobium sp. L1K21]